MPLHEKPETRQSTLHFVHKITAILSASQEETDARSPVAHALREEKEKTRADRSFDGAVLQ